MKKFLLFSILANLFFASSYEQTVAITNDGLPPNASAMLDVRNPNKGLLIPRVALSGTTDAATIPSPAISLLVYNTASKGTGGTSVKPGYYYWSGTEWLMLGGGSGTATSWLLTGNMGTDTSVNFLGTTDNKSLQFKVSDIRAGYIGVLNNDGNVFWGYQSGLNNKGYSNVGLGIKALFSNSTGSHLIAIGDSALFNNAGGIGNTAIGSKALFSNTTGGNNTANGGFALFSNTTGYANTANGKESLFSNTTGYNNAATGTGALFSNTTGINNTANGAIALYSNTTGGDNTVNGNFSLFFNTTGNYNTATGSAALSSNTTGTGNTAIGYQANVSSGALTNATVIGYNAMVNASNKVRIGNTAVTVIEGQVAYSFPSDARFKYNIQNNVPGLDFIKKLTPVTYYFDDEKLAEYTKTGIINNSILHPASYNVEKQLHTGFLAQGCRKDRRAIRLSL